MKEWIVTGLAIFGGYVVVKHFTNYRSKQASQFGLAQRGQTQSSVARAPVGIPVYRLGLAQNLPQQVQAFQPTNSMQTSLDYGYAPAFGPMENQPS